MARDRAALRDGVPAVRALMVLNGSLIVLDPHGPVSAWYLLWSFSPLLPLLWFMWVQLRSLRRADEYQRVIQLRALAIGFAAVIVLSQLAGLLDAARMGDPRQSLQVISIGGPVVWVAALVILTKRSG
jgi:hypothetical protein